MLTGRQIREAGKLLRWDHGQFSRTTSLTQTLFAAIESGDGPPPAWLID